MIKKESMMSKPETISQANSIEDIELSVQEIKWLTEIGFIAPQLGHTKVALMIFRALLLCRPQDDFPYIGLATTYLGMGQYTEACELLKKTRREHPNSLEVKSLLAMALKFNHHNGEAERLLTEIIHTKGNSTEPAYALAETLLKPDAINPKKNK